MHTNTKVQNLTRRFVDFITFVELPIRQKFLLFAIGVMFWFLALSAVIAVALSNLHGQTSIIISRLVPHDRVIQKIAANLQQIDREAVELLHTRESASAFKNIESSKILLQENVAFSRILANGGNVRSYSRDDGSVLENYNVTSIQGDQQGDQFLDSLNPMLSEVAKKHALLAESKLANAAAEPDGSGKMATMVSDYRKIIGAALDLCNSYTAHSMGRYVDGAKSIRSTIVTAAIIFAAVLLVASLLLAIFTFWITKSILVPITSMTEQMHSLATSDVDLTKKIAINSKDEIGIMSHEFNDLMDSVHGMATFKKVIEEDDALEDVYSRLGHIFQDKLGINEYIIYEVNASQNKMVPAYPLLLGGRELPCNPDILDNSDLCKAKKTGHTICSTTYPRICKQFAESPDKEHYCIPMIVGGGAGGVIQLTLDRKVTPSSPDILKLAFKAKQYVSESLSVVEAKRLMNTLRESALKDSLTGLYNRRFLQEYTENLVAGAARRGKNIGLIMCDLDYFKQVNDTYGHNAGDAVLKETSALIQNCVRAADLVIRFGGEEFLVVLLDIAEGDALKVAEKIRESVQNAKFKVPDGVLHKTISLGVSEFLANAQAFWQSIKFADVALYKAKEGGRNRSVVFTPDMWEGEQF